MKRTAVLIQTDRFSGQWPDGPDREPPPGRDLADSLLKSFVRNGGYASRTSIPSDWYEHACWHFWIDFNNEHYGIYVECSPVNTTPPTWIICVDKPLGCIGSFFKKSIMRYEVENSMLNLAEQCILEVTGLESVVWHTDDEAHELMLG